MNHSPQRNNTGVISDSQTMPSSAQDLEQQTAKKTRLVLEYTASHGVSERGTSVRSV